VPAVVSVVDNRCDTATNALRVTYDKPVSEDKKGKMAVCMKLLRYHNDTMTAKLAESVEVLSRLGTEKVFFYVFEVPRDASKVLDHYVRKGKVGTPRMTLPGRPPSMERLVDMHQEWGQDRLIAVSCTLQMGSGSGRWTCTNQCKK
jgi:hypothetical protein